jgi:hypothetical protein
VNRSRGSENAQNGIFLAPSVLTTAVNVPNVQLPPIAERRERRGADKAWLNSVQLKCGELQVEINASLIITRVRTLRYIPKSLG